MVAVIARVCVCGKTSDTSDLQDLLIYALQGLSDVILAAREVDICNDKIDRFAFTALFATLTNVNFDIERIETFLVDTIIHREKIKREYLDACKQQNIKPRDFLDCATFKLASGRDGRLEQAALGAIHRDISTLGEDIVGLRLFILYGLKGAAAYLEHSYALGQYDKDIATKYHELLRFVETPTTNVEDMLSKALEVGSLNYEVLAILNKGVTSSFGDPIPTEVNIRAVKGKCILVSGHEFKDLDNILKQTEGKGINVYTHGEMLPANAYPGLKKYNHLVGNYGGAWYTQQLEFAKFPGAIVMTSNCIKDPNAGFYADRIFTRSMVGWPGVNHLDNQDFSKVIEKSLELPGFIETETKEFITIGFGHQSLVSAMPKVIDAVKKGDIKHIYLIGGCDGANEERKYYTDLAKALPEDNIILTLGCAKYRFNKLEFGDINGIPRLIDIGQCNDAYSAIQLALALADAFDCDVNELPLTLSLSWYEQKALVILLTLLSLGIKNITSGPTKPGFMTENMAAILENRFGLAAPCKEPQYIRLN